MGKLIPLRCEACGRMVGSIQEVTEKDDGLEARADHTYEQHLPDCPILKVFLNEDAKFYSLNFHLPDPTDPSTYRTQD